MAGHKILNELSANGMLQIETTCFCGRMDKWNTHPEADIAILMVIPPICRECKEKSEAQRG